MMALHVFQESFSARKSIHGVSVAMAPVLGCITVRCEYLWWQKERMAQILWAKLVEPDLVHPRNRAQSVFQDVPSQVAKRLTEARQVNPAILLQPPANRVPVPACRNGNMRKAVTNALEKLIQLSLRERSHFV